MGRNIGTNVYSNNFEPQVNGLLDARGQAATKADLTTTAQWISTDGNIYAPKAILVAVTDDPIASNNGLYMLKGNDYSVASNWMKIGSEGSAEFIMVDLSSINSIPGTYSPDRYTYEEFTKIIDATANNLPFFVLTFDGTAGLFATSCVTDGIEIMLTILYRDEIWLVNFDGSQYTTSKGGTSPLTNVKVLTTSGLLNTSRKGNLYLSSSDVTIWKNIELGRDIIVYSGSIAQEKQYVPLSISSNGTGSAQVGRVTYMLNGSMYSFKIEYVNPSTYTAGAVTKIENSGDKTIYLTTPAMLDPGWDTDLNQEDTDALKKLYTENNSSITNIVYVGTESGGNQFLVPLSCYSDFGGNSPMDVLFLHPWQQKVYHMVIDVFATPPIAYDPEELIFNSGSSTSNSNVKLLTTPQLLDTTRTTGSIELSAADAAILTGLSVGKDMVFYSGMSGVASQFIPLSVNMVGSGNAKVFLVSFAFYNSLYYFNINGGITSNKYTAGAINRAEGSGGGGIEKISIPFDTIYNLAVNSSTTSADIIAGIGQDKLDKLCDFNLPLDVELTNFFGDGSIYSKKNFMMGDSSNLAVAIYGINNYSFTLNNNNGVYALSLLDQINFDTDINEFSTNAPQNKAICAALKAKQATLVSGTNIKTINGKSILGSGNIDISGSGGADVLKVSLYDLSPTSGTYTVSLGDYSYDSIIALHDSRSSGKVMYAYEFNGEMGMFNISINDLDVYTFYLDYLNKKIKVEYSINRDNTITCIVTDVTKHDLSIDVRINRDKLSKKQTVQYRIRELVTNGYICFLRKKKCSNSHVDYRRNKYTVPLLSFSRGYKIRALDVFAIPCNKVKLNEWTDFPNFDDFIATSDDVLKQFLFKGNVHANPCTYNFATGVVDKHTSVLNCGLQYLVLNPNFVNGVLENNIRPNDVLKAGDMVKFKVRLHCVNDNNYLSGYKLIYSMD